MGQTVSVSPHPAETPEIDPAAESGDDVGISRRYPAAPQVAVAVAVFRPIPGTKDSRAASAAGKPAQTGAEVLLVKRKYPPRAGEWGLPGGRLRLGEKLADGVQRELWEECGIRARLGHIYDAFEPIQYDSAGQVEYHYVVIEFWADYASGEARAADDAVAVAWIPVDVLPDFKLLPDTLEMIRRALHAWQDRTAYGKLDRP